MAYATVAQYVARYGSVSDTAMLQECLNDCSAVIDVELEGRGIDPDDLDSDRLMRACRSMANRIMPDGDSDIPVGVKSMSTTAGPYTEQLTFSTAYGTPRMDSYVRRMLGIGARIGFGALAGRDD